MNLIAKNVLTSSMAALLVFTLSACGTKTETPTSSVTPATTAVAKKDAVTVSYLAVSSQLNYGGIKDLIANWEKKTGNKVDIQAIPDDQYDNLVKAKLAGGSDVDIFFGSYQKYDVPNQLLEISGEAYQSRLTDVALQSMKYTDGKIYAFPTPAALSAWGVYYNKKVYSDLGLSVPKTTAELNKNLEAIKAKGVTPIYFAAGKDAWTMLQHRNAVNGVVGGMDPSVWDKLNKNQIQWKDIPSFVDQYKLVEDWVKKGYFNKDLGTANYEQSQQALVDGKAAMVVQGSWFEAEFLKKKADAPIGWFPYPNQDGTEKIPVSGSNQVYIAKSSKHAEAAKDLLRYLSEKEQVTSYLTVSPGLSAFKDVDVSDKLTPAAKDIQAFVKTGNITRQADEVYIVPMPYDDLVAAYTELLFGKITAEQFVQKHGDLYVKNAKQAKIPGF